MNTIRKNLVLLTPVLLLLLLSSCSKHDERMFAAGFFFTIIFVLFCVPALILAAVSRTASSNAPKTISIIFTSIGGFFGLFYTISFMGDPYVRDETSVILYMFLMWGSLITSAILLGAPNNNKPAPKVQQPVQQRQTQQQMSEAAILAAAEKIKQKKAQEASAANSEYLNPKPEAKKGDVDVSGLDDLADL